MAAGGSVYFIPHLVVVGMVIFGETVGKAAAKRKKRNAAKADGEKKTEGEKKTD